jgi:Uma2 family endonuclease
MTLDEFLVWQAAQDRLYEYVDGQPVAMAGAQLRHDRITVNAIFEVRRQLRDGGSPCDVFTADIGIRTPAGRLRRPEMSVLCPPFDEDAMTSDRPRLVVEVLSETTADIDRFFKLDEYKAIPSIDYIIIVDPTRIAVGFWHRGEDGRWFGEMLTDEEAVIDMPGLALAVPLASLYLRVRVEPQLRPRLVWGAAEPASGSRAE